MKNPYDNYWIPDDGYKYLVSDDNIWTTEIFLGRTDDINNWHDTNDEPPDIE